MTTITNVHMLIPDTEDIYTADIRHFFLTVASLVSNDFMSVSVEAEQSKPLASAYLKKIYDSYYRKLTKPENLTPTLAMLTDRFSLECVILH